MPFASVSYTHQWTAPTELNTVQHNLTGRKLEKGRKKGKGKKGRRKGNEKGEGEG